MHEKKLVFTIIGDKGVGKTSLLYWYNTDEFNNQYTETTCDHYESQVQIEGNEFVLEFWDVGAKDDHESIRKFWVSQSSAFVVAFNLLGR